MNKCQRLRNRIKQLEHKNKAMLDKCNDFDEIKHALFFVKNLYEQRCKQDGYTDEQLSKLRRLIIKDKFIN